MKYKDQRGVLSQTAISKKFDRCAPPSDNYPKIILCRGERTALCVLKGSMTMEAALLLPFVMMIFFAFFLFFSHYASAAEAKALAAAEAKTLGILVGSLQESEGEDITIYKTVKITDTWINPFSYERSRTERAVCRAWVGFTDLETEETYVYVTPNGSVYHLYADCTHLKLSVRKVTLQKALAAKNEYGESYRPCRVCEEPFQSLVYITSEGDCYHSGDQCSGLKRTVLQIPVSEVQGRPLCTRCTSRKES